ncbi:MAG: hypothetical protein HYV28_02260 [Ignavibacteriales bacterium]|nr:hypothetical protein [Ignavibacteriales bacterium]
MHYCKKFHQIDIGNNTTFRFATFSDVKKSGIFTTGKEPAVTHPPRRISPVRGNKH